MFRFYLLIIAIPFSLIATFLSVENGNPVVASITTLPDLVIMALIITALAGLLMTAIVVDIRFESIIYSKTINVGRRFFADKADQTQTQGIRDYLVLPDYDEYPTFYEQPWNISKRKPKWNLGVTSTFLQVIVMGCINAALIFMGFASLINNLHLTTELHSKIVGAIIGFGFFLCHVLGYWYFATRRDKSWPTKYKLETSESST